MSPDAKRGWRDWCRGFSDADRESVWRKINGPWMPGEVIDVTNREYKAWLSEGEMKLSTFDTINAWVFVIACLFTIAFGAWFLWMVIEGACR